MSDEDVETTRSRASDDPFCDVVGIDLETLEEGRAVTTLTVSERHCNFHGTPHGGAVYTLADAAFAAASNSHGETAVALETNMSYLGAASVGDTLEAVATETHTSRRTAEYQVVVRDADDRRLASFRGRVYKP